MKSHEVTYLKFVPAVPADVQDSAPMSVVTYQSGNWFVVEVAGDLDLLSSPYLRPLLEEHPFVVLDLRRVSFMDSSGLRLLVDRARSASGASGSVRVGGASPLVRRLVELAPFHEPISMFDSVAEALSAPTATPGVVPGGNTD